MDRLWDVWKRERQTCGLALSSNRCRLTALSSGPFSFLSVDGDGHTVATGKAGSYVNTSVFGYVYEPGFGEDIISQTHVPQTSKNAGLTARAAINANMATLLIPHAKMQATTVIGLPLIINVTVSRPQSPTRLFDVLVNAPASVTHVNADSPYYAGTISFFGPAMDAMNMSGATFAVPLLGKKTSALKTSLEARNATLQIRVVPSNGRGAAPALKSVSM